MCAKKKKNKKITFVDWFWLEKMDTCLCTFVPKIKTVKNEVFFPAKIFKLIIVSDFCRECRDLEIHQE